MGVWNLGVGAVGQNSVQGWVPGKISPGGKKEHMIQYTILKTHESPLKRGASSKGKDCFTICYFSGDMWMFWGCFCWGLAMGHGMPVSTKTNLGWIVDAVWSPLGMTFTFHWYRRRGIYPNWKMMIHPDGGIAFWFTKAWQTKMPIPFALSVLECI